MVEKAVFREVDRLPAEAELHHWADYVELLCLLSPDGMISPAELNSRLQRGRDIGEATVASTQGDPALDPDTIDELLGLFDSDETGRELSGAVEWDDDLDEVPTPSGVDVPDSEHRDSYGRRVEDIWLHLRYRQSAFGADWPFRISGNANALTVGGAITARHRAYIFLLHCSSLRYMQRSPAGKLTAAFEGFAHRGFAGAFPGWEVHVFGTTAVNGSRYHGAFWDKVVQLADDVRCRLLVERGDLHPGESGDNGLDLVAWLPLPDNSKGLPLAFAQCACGASNWKSKQSEASAHRWSQALHLTVPLQNWTFIPFCYHGPRGDWETPHEVAEGVLIDRLRLVSLLGDALGDALAANPIANEMSFDPVAS